MPLCARGMLAQHAAEVLINLVSRRVKAEERAGLLAFLEHVPAVARALDAVGNGGRALSTLTSAADEAVYQFQRRVCLVRES